MASAPDRSSGGDSSRAIRCAPLLVLLLFACSKLPPVVSIGEPTPDVPRVVTLAEAPPMTAGQFPCSDCHDPTLPVKTARHKLTTAHMEIDLQHGNGRLWCFDCHDVKNRDQLRSASGEPIAFADVQQLCGQCHGHQLRDWEHGAHGKRTGSFTGAAVSLRCASCHPAHAPHFRMLTPKPAPRHPERTK